MSEELLIPLPRLLQAMRLVVRAFGSRDAEVEAVVQRLVEANLTGHDSHGIGMLPRYAASFLEGSLQPNAELEVLMDAGALLRLDGGAGFGQVIGEQAMALGNAHHLGRIGAWAGPGATGALRG